jgi:Carboxypeptidase regulatory-like domain/TonB-dependent Receptor Plug Domain/TonB dependent receptor
MKLSKRTIFFTLACVMLCGIVAFGQSTSGTISGTMLDPQGNALSGATVKIKNLETGAMREVTSNSSGAYRVTGLAPGRYEVEAAAQGFATETRGELALTVAEEVVVNFNLKVGVARESVNVEVQSVNVETTGSTLSGLVDEKKIRDLPLDGRDITQLIFLQPGVVESRGSAQTSNTGRGSRFSISGARPSQNLFQIDGTTINDALNNTPGSAQGLLLGVETIREFRVLTNTFSAEYGRAAGGVFIAVTKSGSNDFHGSVFEFLRNDQLDARQFFDRCTGGSLTCDNGGRPEFRRNQFGGAIGGPIIKNKTFFFGSYEGLRELKGVSFPALVPDANARNGIVPGRTSTTVDPRSQALLALFPTANGGPVLNASGNPTGVAIFNGVTNRISNGDFFTAKVDHQLSASDSLSLRYLVDDSDFTLTRFFPNFPNQVFNRKTLATIEERKFIGSNIVNEARFGFNRSTPSELVPIPSDPTLASISFIAGRPLGELNVTGLSPAGTDRTNPKLFFQNDYQFTDNLFINLGRNNLKMGFSYDRFQFNGRSESRTRGRLRFRSLSDFLSFNVQNMEGTPLTSDFVRGFRQSLFGVFFQDDFKFNPRLTLNLGVRYEFATSPDEVNGKLANLRSITGTSNNPTDLNVGQTFFETPTKNIAPRFGFAYDVFGDGKTAVRGGFGLFFEEPLFNAYRQAAYGTLPFIQTSALSAAQVTALPVSPAAFGAGTPLTETITFDLRPTYMMQYNLNVQREFFGTVMSVAYVGSRGVNLFGQGDLNTRFPSQILADGRPFFIGNEPFRNPNFSTIRSAFQGFSSNYNALNLSGNRRFNNGLQFQAAYTFGKSLDNRSGNAGRQEYSNGQARAFDPFNRQLDYGRSDFDVRHTFTANVTYELPFGKGLSGIAGAALRGWQVNSIVKIASGIPFTPLVDGDPDRDGSTDNAARPDLIGDPNTGPRTAEQWYNLNAFAPPTIGTRGTSGRNIVSGPNFRNVDLSVNKMFVLTERFNLQFRAEAFNLLNRTNFDLPSNSDDGSQVFSFSANQGTFSQLSTAGQINNIVGTAREIQLGLKLIF